MSFMELQAGRLEFLQQQQRSLRTNFIQGPPPLISDQSRSLQLARQKQLKTNYNTMPSKSAGDSSLAGIPGVYFNYQLQQSEEALLQIKNNEQLRQPQDRRHSLPLADSELMASQHSQAIGQAALEFFEPNQAKPPPLVRNKDWSQPLEEKITQQILSSTSKLLNFIQIRVLSSINASIGRKPSLEGRESRDASLTPSSDSSSPQALNFEHNYMQDLQSKSSNDMYMTTSLPVMTTKSLLNTSQVHFTPEQLRLDRNKRQKKTREEKLAYLRQYARERRARETPEQREARLADLRARQRKRKANETPEQRRLRLERDRLKTGRYRAKKRSDFQEHGISIHNPFLSPQEHNGVIAVTSPFIRPTMLPFTMEQ